MAFNYSAVNIRSNKEEFLLATAGRNSYAD